MWGVGVGWEGSQVCCLPIGLLPPHSPFFSFFCFHLSLAQWLFFSQALQTVSGFIASQIEEIYCFDPRAPRSGCKKKEKKKHPGGRAAPLHAGAGIASFYLPPAFNSLRFADGRSPPSLTGWEGREKPPPGSSDSCCLGGRRSQEAAPPAGPPDTTSRQFASWMEVRGQRSARLFTAAAASSSDGSDCKIFPSGLKKKWGSFMTF